MPLPVIADVFRVTLDWSAPGNSAANVFHVLAPTVNETDIANAVSDAIGAHNWFDAISNLASVETVTVLPLDGTSAGVTVPCDTNAGSSSGQFIPAACHIISLQTAVRGPSGRGRIYTPFVSEAAQENGFIANATNNTAQADFEDFGAALLAADIAIVVASYVNEETHEVTGITARRKMGTQRRRQTRQA